MPKKVPPKKVQKKVQNIVLIKVWGLLKVPKKVRKKSAFTNKSAKKSAFTNKSAQKSTLKSTFGSSEPIWSKAADFEKPTIV